MRVLRVGLGLTAGIAGMVYRDPLVAMLGSITLLQGVFNLACCSMASCATPAPQRPTRGIKMEYPMTKK